MEEEELDLSQEILITAFDMDLSDLLSVGESRNFAITGSNNASFELEVRDEDAKYYNFYNNTFQVSRSVLSKSITDNGVFKGEIDFPLITDDDQYDISLTATGETSHSKHSEVRFGDGSLDINSSTGSNSRLVTKVIYQPASVSLTLTLLSVGGTLTGTAAADVITVSTGEALADTVPFSISWTVANDKALRVIKQPQQSDALAFVSANLGSAPINIPGEDIYPNLTAHGTSGVVYANPVTTAVTSGAIVQVDGDVTGNAFPLSNIIVGDKITTAVTTDTVNGEVSSGTTVEMDNAAANTMAVGDQVTGNAVLDAGIYTVVSTSGVGFELSSAVVIADGITLTFSSKINRDLTTVASLEPTSGTNYIKKFTMSQDIQLRSGAPLNFQNQMNYRWPIDNSANLMRAGFIVASGTNVEANTELARYSDTTTVFADTEMEKVYINHEVEAVDTLSLKPVITKGIVTTQAGAIVFNKPQPLTVAEEPIKVGGYGRAETLNAFGYDVILTDLTLALTEVSTTTTAAVINSTSVPVASLNGILDDYSTVSGIGIDAALANPTVDTGAGAVTGAGTLVLTAPQTLESGTTLTFANAGLVATLTGDVRILKVGNASQTLRFNLDNLVTIT